MIVIKAEPHETSREGNQEGGTHHPVDHQTLNLIAQNQGHNNTIDIPDIRRENPYIDLPDQLPILKISPNKFSMTMKSLPGAQILSKAAEKYSRI